MGGFCEHKLRSLRRNAARPAKLTGCKWLLSSRLCRTYRDIPCRIRLSIASLLKISAFRKPRSLPTILVGSFSSSRLYFPHSCHKSNNRCEASAGNRPRRLQAPELVSSVHCSASRCRTDRQPAANRTSTAPRISIPITSSSFLRQKAPQAGIKHASAPALRKHMP